MKTLRSSAFLAAASLLVASSLHATDGNWTSTSGGNWSTGFSGGTPADGTDAIATFGSNITGATTVTLDSARTVGTINFNDTGTSADSGWTISSANSSVLTLATSSGTPVINLGAPNGNISDFISVALAGTQGLTVNATSSAGNEATLVLSGSLSNLSGAITINGGTLQLVQSASLYNGNSASWTAANLTVKSGATLALNVGGTGQFTSGNVDTLLSNISVASSATSGLQSGATIAFDTTNAAGNAFTQGNIIGDSTGVNGGAIGLTKLGSNTLVLDKVNTYTGGTTVTLGILSFASGALGTTGNITMNGGALAVRGTLQWNGSNTDDISSRIVMINGKTAAIDTNGNDVVFASAIGNSSTSACVKLGTGTLTFSGVNTYTGATTVAKGTLIIASGAQVIAAAASGIVLSTGAALTVDGTIKLTSGSATIANTAGGAITLNAASSVLNLGAFFNSKTAGSTYQLITGTTSTTGNFGTIRFTGATNFDTVNFDNTTGKLTFSLTAVPEPPVYGLVGAGAIIAAVIRRRRKAPGTRV